MSSLSPKGLNQPGKMANFRAIPAEIEAYDDAEPKPQNTPSRLREGRRLSAGEGRCHTHGNSHGESFKYQILA